MTRGRGRRGAVRVRAEARAAGRREMAPLLLPGKDPTGWGTATHRHIQILTSRKVVVAGPVA